MTVQLSMVGLIVKDMATSLAFYRQVGLKGPRARTASRLFSSGWRVG